VDKADNFQHWERWAAEYGVELRATTKCTSIKRLEVEALLRQISRHREAPAPLVLEIGCGNGANGFALASRDPGLLYVGLDFSPQMILNAADVARRRAGAGLNDRLAFGVADARKLVPPIALETRGPHYAGAAAAARLPAQGADVVFTDRMLINLASAEEQLQVMRGVAELVRPGGLFLMIENSVQTHRALNDVRVALGLPARPAADYNVFIDEKRVIEPFKQIMQLVEVDDFGSIHDLLLYAVGPALSGGEVQYDSPLMTRTTDAILALAEKGLGAGGFGQNRLWVWRR
jgi:SAM-dependent methyltransferase